MSSVGVWGEGFFEDGLEEVGGVGAGTLDLGHELGPALLELIRDELEEDQGEDDVLVFRGLD